MNLFTGEGLLQSLNEFESKQRDNFDSFEKSAKQINSVTQNFIQNKRIIKRKKQLLYISRRLADQENMINEQIVRRF